MADVFGDAVPMFEGPAEFAQLIRYYLDHPDERQAKAAMLPQLVHQHSYVNRARQVAEDIAGLSALSRRTQAPQKGAEA